MAKGLTVKQRIDKLINDVGGVDNVTNENMYAMTDAESNEFYSRTPIRKLTDKEIFDDIDKNEIPYKVMENIESDDFDGVIRCSESVLDIVSETQCDVFIVCTSCNRYDLDSFARYYLNSDIRKEIDNGNIEYCTMEYRDIISRLDLASVKKTDEDQDCRIADFAGMFLSEMQWELGIPSGEVLGMFSIDDIKKYFTDFIKDDKDYILWLGDCIEYFIRKRFNLSCSGRREYHGDDYFGNWYSTNLSMDGKSFRSVGQYLAYKKALLFSDASAARTILDTIDRKTIENLVIKNFDNSVWEQHHIGIMKEAMHEKFKQNKKLRNMLLETENSEIAWCDENDTVFGIGVSVYNPERFNREKWKGQNRLGQYLMEIREAIGHEKCSFRMKEKKKNEFINSNV